MTNDNQFGEDQPSFVHSWETADFSDYFAFKNNPVISKSKYGIVMYTFFNTPRDVMPTIIGENRIIFTHPSGAKEAVFVSTGIPYRSYIRKENGIIEVTFVPQILYTNE